MDPPPAYSPHLQSILSHPSAASNDVPTLDQLSALHARLDVLQAAAARRLQAILAAQVKVEALRDRDLERALKAKAQAEAQAQAQAQAQAEREREKDRLKRDKDRARKEAERDQAAAQLAAAQARALAQAQAPSSDKRPPPSTSSTKSQPGGGGGKSQVASQVKLEPDLSTAVEPLSARQDSAHPASDDSDGSSVALTRKKQKNKKRKHGVLDSDTEGPSRLHSEAPSARHSSRDRSVSMAPPPVPPASTPAPTPSTSSTTITIPRPKIKLFASNRPSSPVHTPGPSTYTNVDFHLPPAPRSLVPPRPPVPVPPPSGPMKQSEVNEDFTNAKPGTQLLYATFWQAVEPYVRSVGEEDLAFLKGYKDDDVEPYLLPPLGRHYQHAWDEEDRLQSLGLPPPPVLASSPLRPSAGANRSLDYARMTSREAEFSTADLQEEDLVGEDRGAGPLTERVVSALMAARDVSDAPIKLGDEAQAGAAQAGGATDEDAPMEGLEDDDARPPVGRVDPSVGMGDLEERIKQELQLIGLLGEEEVDWSQRADDEISTSLRQCQKLLAAQCDLNESRRSTLLSIAQDRLAFSEYQQCLDGLDRIIDAGWTKRLKALQRLTKKKDRSRSAADDARDRLEATKVGDQVKQAIDKRRIFIEHVGGMFRAEEAEDSGRFSGIPDRSVYDRPPRAAVQGGTLQV